MKRRWFSPSLWREGVRQLSLIGIMSLVVLELCAILVPVGLRVSRSNLLVEPRGMMGASSVESLWGIAGIPLLVLLPLVIAPLMTLYLFRFLNKRNASDFYHQLPMRRECLFLSFFTAILFWLTVLAVSAALTCRLFFRILLSGLYVMPLDSLWIFVWNMLAGGVLAAAVTAIVMSVTGSTFNNVIGTVLLLYLPRVVLLIAVFLLRESLPILADDATLPLLDVRYNVPAGLILGGFSGNWGDVLQKPSSGVYSLVLAALYTAVALRLFVRRQSEAAERASHSPKIQRLLCVVTGFAVSLLPISIITDLLLQRSDALSDWLFWLTVLYILTLLAMLIYQLITMRRFKALARVFPAFGIVLLLNAAFTLSVWGFREAALSFTPSAEQIDSVAFYEKNDFFMGRTAAPELEDEELCRMTANLLSTHVADIRRERFSQSEALTARHVRIRAGWRTVTRVLYLNTAQEKLLTDLIVKNEATIRAYATLPSLKSNGLSVSCTYTLNDPAALPSLYETFCTEVEAYAQEHFSDWYRYVCSGGNEESDGLSATPFSFRLTRQGASVTIYIPMEFSRTITQYAEQLPDAAALSRYLDDYKTGSFSLGTATLVPLRTAGGGLDIPWAQLEAYFWDENSSDNNALIAALQKLLTQVQPLGDDMSVFTLDLFGSTDSRQYRNYTAVFCLPSSAQEDLDALAKLVYDSPGNVVLTDEEADYSYDETDPML